MSLVILTAWTVSAHSQTRTATPKPSAQARWAAIERHHAAAEKASLAAIDAHLDSFGKFLEQSKAGGVPFAQSLQGDWAKFAYVQDGFEQVMSSIGRTFGSEAGPPPDSFSAFVVEEFKKNVLPPGTRSRSESGPEGPCFPGFGPWINAAN